MIRGENRDNLLKIKDESRISVGQSTGLVVPLFIGAPESAVTNPRPHGATFPCPYSKGQLNGSRTKLRGPARLRGLLERVR